MVAKNLLRFVGVGILSGLVLGLYMLDTKGEFGAGIITITDEPSISILSEKPTFKDGEEITFRIVNSGNVPLYSEKDSIYGAIITGLSGIPIYVFEEQNTTTGENQNQEQQKEQQKEQQRQMISDWRKCGQFKITPNTDKNNYYFTVHTQTEDIKLYIESKATITEQDTTQPLLPGDEIQISWNQTRHDGNKVQAGVYKISLQAIAINMADCSIHTTIKDSNTITIQ